MSESKIKKRCEYMAIEGFTEYAKEDRQKYNRMRWWLGMTWGDMFDKATDLYPDKVGLVDDTGRWTYAELRNKVDRLAISLIKLGIKPRDWVLLQFPNWHEYILAFFAMQKIGALTVLLIPRHNQSEVNHLCALTKPVAWMLPGQYGKINYQPIIDDVLKENGQLKHIIQVRTERNGRYPTLDEMIEKTELTTENLRMLEERRPDPDEVSHIMPTGGTTGLPKASVRTHNSYITNVEYHSRAWEITSNDTLLVATPVGHSMAMHWGIGAAFFNYAKLVLLDSTQPEDICEWVQKEKVTAIPSVPALITRVVSMEGLEKYDLTSLKKISVGGAPSTRTLSAPFMTDSSVSSSMVSVLLRAPICQQGRATTWTLSAIVWADLPVLMTRSKSLMKQARKFLPASRENWYPKGPGVFTGYFRSQEENSQIFTSDGFFKTGDKARKDQFGNITITGRIKDIINRGGEKISALDIENRMSEHPAIQRCGGGGHA